MNADKYKEFSSGLKQRLLEAPDGHLDASAKPLIERWSEPVTSLQILEVLDICVYAALASPLTMHVLNTLLGESMNFHNETYESVVAKADWRKNAPYV